MTVFVLDNYFPILLTLGLFSVALRIIFLFLGFEEGWSIWSFFGKATALMNIAIVVPLYAALDDPKVFEKLKGADGVVFLAIFVISYAAIQSLVPKYLAEKVVKETKKKFTDRMNDLKD